jgi:thioredoxin 1
MFPTDRPAGVLAFALPGATPEYLAARGPITVPSGAKCHLTVGVEPDRGVDLTGFIPGDLSGLRDLESDALIGLVCSRVAAGSLEHVAHLTELAMVSVEGDLADSDLSILGSMTNLQMLVLRSDVLTVRTAAHLERLTGLVSLDLGGAVAPEVVAAAYAGKQALQMTKLLANHALTAEHLDAIPLLRNVSMLVLGAPLSSDAFDALLELPSRLPALKALFVSAAMDPAVDASLRRRYPQLAINGTLLTPSPIAPAAAGSLTPATATQLDLSGALLEVTHENLEHVLASATPVLIDFWAEWCGPCRTLAPTVEELAAELKGKVVVAKCDVERVNEVTARFGILGLPSLILVHRGVKLAQIAPGSPDAMRAAVLSAIAG